MELTLSVEQIGDIIKLALAPVFLLVGIGAVLNVVTHRVGRIIDRARMFEGLTPDATNANTTNFSQSRIDAELTSLNRRMKFANWSITFLVAAALMICVDVILLFANGLVTTDLTAWVLVLFIASMSFITGGLLAFFFEVSLATATLKITTGQKH